MVDRHEIEKLHDQLDELTLMLSFQQKLLADQLLNTAYYHVAPHRQLADVREKTLESLRRSSVAPGANVDRAMALQTKMIAFAERFFDRLRGELDKLLQQEQNDGR